MTSKDTSGYDEKREGPHEGAQKYVGKVDNKENSTGNDKSNGLTKEFCKGVIAARPHGTTKTWIDDLIRLRHPMTSTAELTAFADASAADVLQGGWSKILGLVEAS